MKQRRHRFYPALIALALGAVLYAVVPASADLPQPPDPDFYSGVCVEFADTLDPSLWIPVGCELDDCCPRCAGNVIDWRIIVAGAALESVVLQFDNLPPDALRALKIKGRARWEGNSLRVWKGQTLVSGFKSTGRSAPPVATPRLFANKDALRRLQQLATPETGARVASPDARELGRMEVMVEQLMGKYVVNESRLAYNVTKCASFPANTDHFLLSNNVSNDSVAVILDARDKNGCFNDETFRGTETVFVGDLRLGNCNSEAAIFSDDNAMAFVSNVTWTDSIFDKNPVSLQPIRVVPVAVWLARPNNAASALQAAQFEMGSANVYYNFHNTGISFNATYTDISTNANALFILSKDCSFVNDIKTSNFYSPNQINVYYVQNPTANWNGRNCWGAEPNIIFINTTPTQETLAHEIGHSFSLDHPNDDPANVIPGFAKNNIMWKEASGRTDFTLGQAFRMNMNVTSTLNVNGVRTGPVRDPPCADAAANDLCPRLALDAAPK